MFRTSCALKIRTYDVEYRDGTRATIRADVSVAARMVGPDVIRATVRGY